MADIEDELNQLGIINATIERLKSLTSTESGERDSRAIVVFASKDSGVEVVSFYAQDWEKIGMLTTALDRMRDKARRTWDEGNEGETL